MKILVTGGGGTLARVLSGALAREHEVLCVARRELDVTDGVAIGRCLDGFQPDWVAHLAALTDVDRCQREPDLAFAVNAVATENLARTCDERGIGVLFSSSLAVFDGHKSAPYTESDGPNPANLYGASKRRGEEAVAGLRRHLIVRTGWLVEGSAADTKFVGRVLRHAAEGRPLRAVVDKVGSPTSVQDLSHAIVRLLAGRAQGLRHVVNAGGPVSRFDLARRVAAIAGLDVEVEPVSSDAFPGLAPRPTMEAGVSEHGDAGLRHWTEALADCLRPISRR